MARPLHPALVGRVRSIEVIESRGRLLVLPRPGAVLGLQLRGRVRAEEGLLSPAGVTGTQRVARAYEYLGETRSILVRFTPDGAASFGLPAGELSGRSAGLEALIAPGEARRLVEQTLEAADDAARIACVERLLLRLPARPDPQIARACALLGAERTPGVAAVAREVGLSERQLERRFSQRVGLGPRGFAGLSRLGRAIDAAARGRTLTEAALDAGYYDQSHFIRDFQRATGAAPGQLLAR